MLKPLSNHVNTEWYVVFGLILFMLCLEAGIRVFEKQLSGNIAHIKEIPHISSKVNQAKGSVLFLGNSLTNNAIDVGAVENSLSAMNASITEAFKVTPDGTGVADWSCIYNNQIKKLNNPPELLVIGYAWGHLSDQATIHPSRLGAFFCNLSDIQTLDSTGITHHTELLRFFAGRISHVYVNREAIRNRTLLMAIPFYETATQKINEEQQSDTSPEPEKQYTYSLLTKLLKSAKEQGVQVVIIAMPVINRYELDENLVSVLNQEGAMLLDKRDSVELTSENFKDSMHLNQRAGKLFSASVARQLSVNNR